MSTLHPVASHILGPSTTFSCPAVTQKAVQGTDHIFTTYAAVEGSSDLSAENSGRTIWMWRENLSSSLTERASQKKTSAVVRHSLHSYSPKTHLTDKSLDAASCYWTTHLRRIAVTTVGVITPSGYHDVGCRHACQKHSDVTSGL